MENKTRPPLISTVAEIEDMLDIIYKSIQEVTETDQTQYDDQSVAAVMV